MSRLHLIIVSTFGAPECRHFHVFQLLASLFNILPKQRKVFNRNYIGYNEPITQERIPYQQGNPRNKGGDIYETEAKRFVE